MNESRQHVLARIRAALDGVTPAEPALPVTSAPRMHRAALLESFAYEAERVGARVLRANRAEVGERLKGILAEWSVKKVVLSRVPLLEGLNLEGLLRGIGLEVSVCAGASSSEGDRTLLLAADAGVTDADFGLADTGTLVSVSRPEQGRGVSLLPPIHIAVLEAERIVENLEALFQALPAGERARASSAITFITGPSRTADIEQTLTVGVHGPGRLAILLLE